MIPEPQKEQQIRRALLGLGSFDPDWDADEIEFVAESLVDEYVGGELSSEERGRFESYFLSQPGNRDRLAFAESLHRKLTPPRPRWGLRLGLGMAAIAACLVLYWNVAVVPITPGVLRDAEAPVASVTRYAPVRLRLLLPADFQPGPAEVVARDGDRVLWRRRTAVRADGAAEVWVAPYALPVGEVTLEVTGMGSGRVLFFLRVK